jgi:hypothetical protein
MIFDPSTVMILGAGASAPYGFPLGRGLKEKIIQQSGDTNKSAEREQYLKAGFSQERVTEFNTALTRSHYPTIHAFLEDRPSLRETGAFGIAAALMPLESQGTLFPPKDWYPALFQGLDLKNFTSISSIPAIITFNYDRSLEHYLTVATQSAYESEVRKHALDKLRRLRIIHVYGQLGDYPAVPYDPAKNVEDFRKAAKEIRMIYDQGIEESDGFAESKRVLENARDVIILGFGYDERSVRRMGLSTHIPERTIFGTAYGLGREDRERIGMLFGAQRINLDPADRVGYHYLGYFEKTILKDRKGQIQQ